ncbi:MAG: hypothetical protein EXS13_01330 [Planctomycetes bacterium]|nr:hypothetical protein [Planctomycetota bacterium]
MQYAESQAPPDLAPPVRRFWSLRDVPEGGRAATPRPIERVVPSSAPPAGSLQRSSSDLLPFAPLQFPASHAISVAFAATGSRGSICSLRRSRQSLEIASESRSFNATRRPSATGVKV